jgi:hypothetical protein
MPTVKRIAMLALPFLAAAALPCLVGAGVAFVMSMETAQLRERVDYLRKHDQQVQAALRQLAQLRADDAHGEVQIVLFDAQGGSVAGHGRNTPAVEMFVTTVTDALPSASVRLLAEARQPSDAAPGKGAGFEVRWRSVAEIAAQ